MSELEKISELLKQKKTGSDYTATVTSVKDGIAYVKMEGSDIADTPVKLTIGAKPGDTVKVRVANGQAWITGNLTEPPTNDEKKVRQVQNMATHIREMANKVIIAVGGKMDKDMKNRPSSIVIDSGKISFESNAIVIHSDNFTLEENGDATFSGKLQAAEGSFDGTLTFLWGEDNPQMTQEIIIGESTDAPFIIRKTSSGESTTMHAGEIVLSSGTWPPVQVYGNVYEGWQPSSDEKLKHNIEDLEGLDIVMRLRPVTFVYNGDPNEKKRYGFTAQNVREIMPEAVNEKDGTLTLSYTSLIAPAIAAIKEQQKKIELLEQEIAELRNIRNEVNDGK